MLVELPLWGLILLTIGSFLISFVIIKMMGTKILYSIAIAFILPLVLLFILHTFDVKDGVIIPHVGDFYSAIFIAISLLYYIFLIFYITIYITLRDRFCKKDDIMEKIKLAYESPEYEKLDNPEDLEHKDEDAIVSLPIDIPSPVISGKNYDFRSMTGSLKKEIPSDIHES